MSLMTRIGTLSYNGVEMNVTTQTKVSMVPKQSTDERTNVGTRYRLSCRCYVTSSNEANQADAMEDIRAALTRNGGILILDGIGFGDLNVNGSNNSGALDYGPWPKINAWMPHGPITAELDWEVEWMQSDCNPTPYNQLSEYAWTASFSHDASRLERRTIKGHIAIPGRKRSVDDPNVYFSVDRYYELCVPPVPLGYERQNENRDISASKLRLDFSFTDAELMTPRPPGVLDYTFRHQQQVAGPGFTKYNGTISASYKMAKHAEMNLSLGYFLAAVRDRFDVLKKAVTVGDSGKINLIPTGYSVTENVHDRSVEYSVSYWTISKASDLMMAAHYRALPGHDHKLWAKSMDIAYKPRGYAQSQIRPQDDVIIDLCIGKPRRPLVPSRTGQRDNFMSRVGLLADCPPPADSYLVYDIKFSIELDDGGVEHRPLPEDDPGEPKANGGGLSLGEREALKAFGGDKGFSVADIASRAANATVKGAFDAIEPQQRATPVTYVVMDVKIVRVCYYPDAPTLTSYGGAEAIPMNNRGDSVWKVGLIGNFGVPIYGATGRFRYALKDMPKKPVGVASTPTDPKSEKGISGTLGGR